jgi:hypothetical protein
MLTRENGEVESESNKSESEEMPPLVDCSDEDIAYPIKGGLGYKAYAEHANQRRWCKSATRKHISHSMYPKQGIRSSNPICIFHQQTDDLTCVGGLF